MITTSEKATQKSTTLPLRSVTLCKELILQAEISTSPTWHIFVA
jgi:hypothetical protein